MATATRQKNLVLILVRELADNLATPAFVTDEAGNLVFYNEPAEEIFGLTFAEVGEVPAPEWGAMFTVEELDGTPMKLQSMPHGIALIERRPASHAFAITAHDGTRREISVTAHPLFARARDFVGVFGIFWELQPPKAN
jgi:PAS domain S-box-containing protein